MGGKPGLYVLSKVITLVGLEKRDSMWEENPVYIDFLKRGIADRISPQDYRVSNPAYQKNRTGCHDSPALEPHSRTRPDFHGDLGT